MTRYFDEIQRVVNKALSDMQELHDSNKLANSPITNGHYLARWVTKHIKSKHFNSCVKGDLLQWQKLCRSRGTQSNIESIFRKIQWLYNAVQQDKNSDPEAILDTQIEAFMEHMEQQGWEVVNEYDLTEKSQVFTEQANGFLLCATQCQQNFDGERLNKPMSFFVRGDHASFVEEAIKNNFLLHKITTYKSRVKYYGEFLIYPNNLSEQLPELPMKLEAKE